MSTLKSRRTGVHPDVSAPKQDQPITKSIDQNRKLPDPPRLASYMAGLLQDRGIDPKPIKTGSWSWHTLSEAMIKLTADTNISPNQWTAFLNGTGYPDSNQIMIIAQKLDVDVQKLYLITMFAKTDNQALRSIFKKTYQQLASHEEEDINILPVGKPGHA